MSEPPRQKPNGIQAEVLMSLLEPLLDVLADKIAERIKPAPKEDRLISVEEACAVLGCTKGWLYHAAKRLPFARKEGGHLRFSANGIQRYIEASKLRGV